MNFPKIGDNAPTFTLLDQEGKHVSLQDYQDKSLVVLYFYPKALTPGCITQACGIRDSQDELAELGATVLGISPDEPKKLMSFTEKKALNFRLISDPDHKIAEQYGVWNLKKFMGKEFMGIVRTTFIIGKDGKLLHIMDKFKTKSHHDDLLVVLKDLQK